MILRLAMVLAAILTFLSCQPATVNVEAPSGEPSSIKGINVTGEGLVIATPDLATLTFQVEVRDASASNAWNRASQAATAVMKVLTDRGVRNQDIKTENLSLQFTTVPRGDRVIVQEYQALNMITVTVRRLEDVGGLVDSVVSAGGENARVLGVSFTIEDSTRYREEARGKAVQDAESRARRLAQAAGVTLGEPESISESGGAVPLPFEALGRGAGLATTDTPVSPGTTEVRVIVSMRYRIIP